MFGLAFVWPLVTLWSAPAPPAPTAPDSPAPTGFEVYSVDDGDLVVASGDEVPEAALGAPERPARFGSLQSARRPFRGKLPAAFASVGNEQYRLYDVVGDACAATASPVRVLCLLTDDGTADAAGTCRPEARSAAAVCNAGRLFALAALTPTSCHGLLAVHSDHGLDVWRPARESAAEDAELLAAFRATPAWRLTDEAFREEPDIVAKLAAHEAVPGWDSYRGAAPSLARFVPPPWRDLELATVTARLHGDGGAPSEALLVIFMRPRGGAWTVLDYDDSAWAPVLFAARPSEQTLMGARRRGHDADVLDLDPRVPRPPPEGRLDLAQRLSLLWSYAVPNIAGRGCDGSR